MLGRPYLVEVSFLFLYICTIHDAQVKKTGNHKNVLVDGHHCAGKVVASGEMSGSPKSPPPTIEMFFLVKYVNLFLFTDINE